MIVQTIRTLEGVCLLGITSSGGKPTFPICYCAEVRQRRYALPSSEVRIRKTQLGLVVRWLGRPLSTSRWLR